jgi:hypothetical protein
MAFMIPQFEIVFLVLLLIRPDRCVFLSHVMIPCSFTGCKAKKDPYTEKEGETVTPSKSLNGLGHGIMPVSRSLPDPPNGTKSIQRLCNALIYLARVPKSDEIRRNSKVREEFISTTI